MRIFEPSDVDEEVEGGQQVDQTYFYNIAKNQNYCSVCVCACAGLWDGSQVFLQMAPLPNQHDQGAGKEQAGGEVKP